MDKVDFIEIATFCVNRAKEGPNRWGGKYERTHYVCILKDNTIRYSMTPHVLRDAHKCILMHEMSEIPISNIYYWYDFEFINHEGCVFAFDLENEFKLGSSKRKQSSPLIELIYKNNYLYSNLNIQKVWELYIKVKDLKTKEEILLVSDLFSKDEKILKLEKEKEDFKYKEELLKQERDQYKDLLDEIKEMVESKSK